MTRTPTPVDALAESYLDADAALDPISATFWGVHGHDDRLPDLSPDGLAEVSALRRRTLAELAAATPADATDEVTIEALGSRLALQEKLRETGAEESSLNNIDSPVQAVRMVFDVMDTATAQDWAVVATRMSRVPAALAGYRESLLLAAARGDVAPRRQVEAVIGQARDNVGFFRRLATSGAQEHPVLSTDLARGAELAGAAYTELADFLAAELFPQARPTDAVGREFYELVSERFIGAAIDLDETYAWGQQELARISADMDATAARIAPGATPREAMDILNADPDRRLNGTAELQTWMQRKSDEAVAELAEVHFDIPQQIRRLECRIAPTNSGGIYYTGPSDDFSRPGRMWWAVPDGVESFSTWRELTTVYHEGVPGHHLQIAQTVHRRGLLNRWRRLASWLSGHGEGWALYAERLMADLGYLDDPGDYLGMLDGQGMRAARVVLDIGIHCGFDAPAEVGGGAWSYEKAWTFLGAHCAMAEGNRRFELDRYLGWPGQAPSYKVGERLWLALREDVRAGEGEAFDLAAFHRRALDVGSVGMDVLRRALLPATAANRGVLVAQGET